MKQQKRVKRKKQNAEVPLKRQRVVSHVLPETKAQIIKHTEKEGISISRFLAIIIENHIN